MTTFRDLVQRADGLAAPEIDVDALIDRGEQQLRRRRLGAVVAAAAIALVAIVGGVLVGSGDSRSNGPIDRPGRHDRTPAPTAPKPRPIVYADGVPGHAIHLGSRTVETGIAFAHMDVTDDGLVYSTGGYRGDGRLWFTDGGAPVQIGSDACEAPHGAPDTVVTGNAGSLVAWFQCVKGAPQSLVVFDTSSRREVVHEELAGCSWSRNLNACTLEAVIDRHVYFTQQYERPGGRVAFRSMRFDVSAGTSSESTPAAYADDIRTHSRGLVVGDSWESGTPISGIDEHFEVVGSRLVPELRLENGKQSRSAAFDAATGQAVNLRVPSGYRHSEQGFELFEWLDDDTVALVSGGGWGWFPGYGDIITCRISGGHCDLTVRGRGNGEDSPPRIVPHLGLPG